MSIIRVIHNRENPYVQLNKQALWNENLSLKATGLWARCMSRPDNWRFVVEEIVSKCKEGRKAIDSAIDELIEHRYAIRLKCWEKDQNGKFIDKKYEYIFFEFPATNEEIEAHTEEFKKSFRNCRFGNFRGGNFQKEQLLNTDREPKIDKKEKEEKGAVSPLSSSPSSRKKIKEPKIEVAPYVWLTKTQEEAFLKNLDGDQEKAKKCYQKLSDWKIGKSITGGKNDYKALVDWVIDAIMSETVMNSTSKISDVFEEDQKFAEKISQTYNGRQDIVIGYNYIEFISGPTCEVYNFGAKNFKQNIKHELTKRGLSTHGLF